MIALHYKGREKALLTKSFNIDYLLAKVLSPLRPICFRSLSLTHYSKRRVIITFSTWNTFSSMCLNCLGC